MVGLKKSKRENLHEKLAQCHGTHIICRGMQQSADPEIGYRATAHLTHVATQEYECASVTVRVAARSPRVTAQTLV